MKTNEILILIQLLATSGCLGYFVAAYLKMKSSRDYWRDAQRIQARWSLQLETMLDAWYFRRVHQKVLAKAPPGMTLEEAQAIIDKQHRECWCDEKAPKQMVN